MKLVGLQTYSQIWSSQISCLPVSTNPLIFPYAHRCTRNSTLLLNTSAPMYALETGQKIRENYLKIIIKKFRAIGYVCQRDITQYRPALTDQI